MFLQYEIHHKEHQQSHLSPDILLHFLYKKNSPTESKGQSEKFKVKLRAFYFRGRQNHISELILHP